MWLPLWPSTSHVEMDRKIELGATRDNGWSPPTTTYPHRLYHRIHFLSLYNPLSLSLRHLLPSLTLSLSPFTSVSLLSPFSLFIAFSTLSSLQLVASLLSFHPLSCLSPRLLCLLICWNRYLPLREWIFYIFVIFCQFWNTEIQ